MPLSSALSAPAIPPCEQWLKAAGADAGCHCIQACMIWAVSGDMADLQGVGVYLGSALLYEPPRMFLGPHIPFQWGGGPGHAAQVIAVKNKGNKKKKKVEKEAYNN